MIDAPLATPAARRARARIIELARSHTADPEFLCELSAEVQQLVPFAASFWAASDPLTTLARSPARVEHLEGQCNRFWEREFLVPDFNLFRDLARSERPVASLVRATGGQPMRSVRYREMNRDLGLGDELRAVLRSGNAVWGAFALWREDGQQSFTVAEERLIADLSGVLAEAFRRAALIRCISTAEVAGSPGLLVFDGEGKLESYNDRAECWLGELLPPPIADVSPGLPISTEIRTVIGLTHAIAAGTESGPARVHVQGRSGQWLVIEGCQLRGAGPSEPKTAITIQPAQPAEVAPIMVEAYDLTPRERQITQMVARGLSTGEMAEQLYLSPHTVRDYVKSVFDKVGVSSRGELVARIFVEHYAEPMRQSVEHAPGAEHVRSHAGLLVG